MDYVILRDGKIQVSPDGMWWVTRTTPLGLPVDRLFFSAGSRWIGVLENGQVITSQDTIVWILADEIEAIQ